MGTFKKKKILSLCPSLITLLVAPLPLNAPPLTLAALNSQWLPLKLTPLPTYPQISASQSVPKSPTPCQSPSKPVSPMVNKPPEEKDIQSLTALKPPPVPLPSPSPLLPPPPPST